MGLVVFKNKPWLKLPDVVPIDSRRIAELVERRRQQRGERRGEYGNKR